MGRTAACKVAFLALVGWAVPEGLSAQGLVAGSLGGRISDPSGLPLRGAVVTVRSDALIGGEAVTTTDALGAYRLEALPIGTYALEASFEGFLTLRREGVRVHAGRALAVDFVLEPSWVREAVTVTAAAPLVSVVDNGVATVFGSRFVDSEPLKRSFFTVFKAAPGVNLDYRLLYNAPLAYGGTSESQNAFRVDGMSGSNSADGGQWLQPSLQFFEEIQVGGPGANAESGGYTGGLITAVTKSGGNETQGRVEAHYQAPSWMTTNTPAGANAESSFLDYAARLGGRIVTDRLWYFVAGEVVDQVRTPLGAADTTERVIPRYLGKLSLQVGPSNRLWLAGEYDGIDSERLGVNRNVLPEASIRQEWRTYAASASWDAIFDPKRFASVRVGGYDGRNEFLPYHGVDQPGRIDVATGLEWVNLDIRHLDRRRVLSADGSWTLLAAGLLGGSDSHALKIGASYESATSSDQRLRNGGFTYFDDSSRCASLEQYRADPDCGRFFVERGWGEYDAHPAYDGFAVFAQDSARFGRATVNVGLRYGEFDGGWQAGHGRPNVFRTSFLDPRVGVAWDVRGDSRTALRAHWGRYHDKMYTYLFDREASGEAALPDQDCFWNPATQAFDRCVPAVTRWARVDDAGLAYVDETLLSLEHQLGASLAVGLDLLDRRFRGIVAMVNANEDYELLSAPNPLTGEELPVWNLRSQQDWVLTVDNPGYRDFRSATLRIDKRHADGWSGRASVVYSDFDGNVSANNGYAREFADRNGETNSDGRMSLAYARWEGKVSGEVDLPLGFQVAGFFSYSSGWYWTPYGRVQGLDYNALTGRDIDLVPRGSEELPDRRLLDLRVAWSGHLGRGPDLTLSVDVFNVFNEDTVLNVQNRWGLYRLGSGSWLPRTDFGTPTQIEPPREIRAGVRLDF